jgi:hypothetical protein
MSDHIIAWIVWAPIALIVAALVLNLLRNNTEEQDLGALARALDLTYARPYFFAWMGVSLSGTYRGLRLLIRRSSIKRGRLTALHLSPNSPLPRGLHLYPKTALIRDGRVCYGEAEIVLSPANITRTLDALHDVAAALDAALGSPT